jgi:REP element-mobilizing transposase RayT
MQRKYEYRRKLPHYQPDFKAFFITFSTHHRWILPESVLHIVIDTCLAGNGRKFAMHAVVVMPDHVHMALTPLVVAEYGSNRCRMNHLQSAMATGEDARPP